MPLIAKKLAEVPRAKPGLDSIGISAPIMMQMNPSGIWESTKPESLDKEQLNRVVKYLVKSNAVNVVQSYCSQCAAENKNTGGKGDKSKSFVPVIMMPVFSPDDGQFDLKAEAKKLDCERIKQKNNNIIVQSKKKEDSEKKSIKKREFQLQRLTDFDLLSQW